jgi:hypothetical protein
MVAAIATSGLHSLAEEAFNKELLPVAIKGIT